MEGIIILILYFIIAIICLMVRNKKYLPMFYGFLFAIAITMVLFIFDIEELLGVFLLILLLFDSMIVLIITIILTIIIIIFDYKIKNNQKLQNTIKKLEPLTQFIVTSFVILFIESIIFIFFDSINIPF